MHCMLVNKNWRKLVDSMGGDQSYKFYAIPELVWSTTGNVLVLILGVSHIIVILTGTIFVWNFLKDYSEHHRTWARWISNTILLHFLQFFFFPFLQLLSLQFLCSLCPRRWVQRGETIGRWEREREIDFESHGLQEVEERNWKLVIYFQVLCVGRWNWLLSLKVWQSGKLIKFFLIVKSNWFFFPSPSHDY